MKKKEGFTLIELMIVVAIIGILAAVAIPSFLRFIRQSKYSEMPINMKAIANGAISWFDAEHTDSTGAPMAQHFPSTGSPTAFPTVTPGVDVTLTPADNPCGSLSAGAMYVKNSQSWNMQPWLALKFSLNKAHYGRYYYETSGYVGSKIPDVPIASMVDLDCDGTFQSFFLNLIQNTVSGNIEEQEIILFGTD